MSKRVWLTIILSGGHVLFTQGDLPAQEVSSDPVEVAARFVMAEQDLAKSSRSLLVDVETSFFPGPEGTSDQLSQSGREAASRVAQSLGARTGTLGSVMVCPAAPPPPETAIRGYRGCHFNHGARVVVQLDDPEVTDEGVLVWVGIWRAIENRSQDARYIAAAGHQVALVNGPDGEWVVTGVKRESRSRW